jgi:hypothetical protein
MELKTQTISESLPSPTISHKRQAAFSLWRGTRLQPMDEGRQLGPGTVEGAPRGAPAPAALPPARAADDQTPPLGTRVDEKGK